MAGNKTGHTLEDLIMVPAQIAHRELQQAVARAKYENRNPGRKHGGKSIPNAERPFIAWDGEGPQDAGYALFGSSEGDEICHPFLGTRECLDLVLARETEVPEAIHIWFGSNYDVSMILRELPWRNLAALKNFTETVWEGYELQHVPHKWFQVRKDGITVKLFDIQPFFGGNYVSSLLAMGVGTDDEIAHLTSEKARRSKFLYSEICDIREYWRLELRLMPVLAGKLRTTFLDAGFNVRSWHGPGSLAHMAMRRHRVPDAMQESSADVRIAARYAFAGGRFEMFRGGHIERTIHNADIRSAYPAFARNLPDLARGTWRRGRYFEPGKFGVYHIRYKAPFDPLRPYPLYTRLRSGEVLWSNNTEGWYWAPEARTVWQDECATFLESYIFDEANEESRPFQWIEDYYHKRQRLKEMGSPLELTFKLIINSVYGQLAQRTGWDRKLRAAPKSHQLEWAGYITSACRARVYEIARRCAGSLVSIDTDGIYSSDSINGLESGTRLGEWDLTTYDEGVFFQSGIYALRKDGEWLKGKTRGIPKGKYSPDQLLAAVQASEPLRLVKHQFTGYGLALNGQRDKLNTWEEIPVEIVLGGQGKRYHNTERWCRRNGHCADGVHEFIPRPVRFSPGDSVMSYPHYLPWLDSDPVIESKKRVVKDLALFDANHLAEDEEWAEQYA